MPKVPVSENPEVVVARLPLSYLALFVGERVNELVLEHLHAQGFPELRHSHGYVFQHLLGAARPISELALLLGVSQQAASKSVRELAEWGYLEDQASADGRVRRVKLSERGRSAVQKARSARSEIERRALARVSPQAHQAVARVLGNMLEHLGGTERVRRRLLTSPAPVEAKAAPSERPKRR